MLHKRIIPLSILTVALLNATDIELSKINVESTLITEVAQNAQVSADISQALSASVPSIDMNRRSGIANDIYIRGQKRDNISIEVDGTKVHGACVNRMDPPISHILANQIDTVEVIEGPYDVETFGTMSGGVKITTKQPTEELHGSLDLGMGAWGYKKVGATVSGGNDIIRLLVSASYENAQQYEDGDGNTIAEQIDKAIANGTAPAPTAYQNQYRDMDAYTKKSLMTKAFIKTLQDQELRLSYTANRSDNILYGNSKMDALYDDSNIYSVEYNIDNISSNYKNINLQYYHSDVDHPMSTKYRKSSEGALPEIKNWLTTDMDGVKLKNTFILDDYKLLVGLDASKRNWDGFYYKNDLPLAGGRKSIDDSTTDNTAIFAKLDKSFGALNITTGFRYDATDIDNNTYQSQSYNAISANIFSSYKFDEQNRVFLGIGSASRVPDARELYFVSGSSGSIIGTPNLKQTTNNEIDLGYELTGDNINFKIKTFYSMLDNYIYIQKGKMMNAFSNIDAYIYGAELSSSYFVNDDISLDMGASYKRGRKDEALAGQNDKDLADMAPLRVNLALNYEYANNSMATIEIQASDRWDDFDADNGEQELAGWSIVNMKLKHALDKHAEITVGVNNLFDKTYAASNTYVDLVLLTTGGDIMLLNEPGRYIYTNLTFKF